MASRGVVGGSGDGSVYTVEGNQAGAAAARLAQQRSAASAAIAQQRDAIVAESARVSADAARFASAAVSTAAADAALRATTVGLLTVAEFRSATAQAEAAAIRASAAPQPAAAAPRTQTAAAAITGSKRKRAPATLLSFVDVDEDELEEATQLQSPNVAVPAHNPPNATSNDASLHPGPNLPTHVASLRMVKDPTVLTSFLPDAAREAREAALRAKLAAEWAAEQDAAKREKLEVVYSYWDGSGHRRSIVIPKGTTIGRFLEWVRQDLLPSFPELKSVSSDSLLYVKEDVIIPHNHSFHELIANRARGKSGPLFHFDVHDDVRLEAVDSRIEKDESHPGKIVERRWYERNKHIFPASRWEVYDPAVVRERYTTHGDEVNVVKSKHDPGLVPLKGFAPTH